ncbi:hypothetical protein V2J09_002974 [Rumex salicifolius]
MDHDSPSTSWICCFGDRLKIPQRTMMLETNTVDVVDKVSSEHLVVMVNGLMGSAADWKFADEQFVKRFPDRVFVHRSECNSAKLTFDGVDLMGERLADEVLGVVKRRPELRKISFIAHSLGGLVARYAIGKLYEPPHLVKSKSSEANGFSEGHEETNMATIAGLQPMNFITFATPHCGSIGHKQLPFLCGFLFLEKQASQTAHLVAGRSGKHLFLTDNDDGKPPLLLRMVTDSYNLKFISALRSFKRRVAYANTDYDRILHLESFTCVYCYKHIDVVGWRTSSIRRPKELPQVNLLVKNDSYPHIVYIEPETLEESPCEASSYTQDQMIDFEEEMIRGLRQVPWERVDVSFHKSKQRYVAHNTIQVKSYWLNSDGAHLKSVMQPFKCLLTYRKLLLYTG